MVMIYSTHCSTLAISFVDIGPPIPKKDFVRVYYICMVAILVM